MTDSPEHKFISDSLDRALNIFAETKLLGLMEAERRKFDYGCLLLRDASRPLVSQVLWGHEEGLEKDVRTLLHEEASSLKMYLIRDKVRNRAKLEDILRSYRQSDMLRPLLRGLRIVPIPDVFDADSEKEREWMNSFILNIVSSDLLFAVVFGKLTYGDLRTFSLHGGPIGLKLAALHLIDKDGFQHGPTFEKRIGSKGSPLREAITMLTGVGFIIAPGFSIQRVPTIKGRFFLDFCRLIAFEYKQLSDWSDETKILLQHLKVDPKEGGGGGSAGSRGDKKAPVGYYYLN